MQVRPIEFQENFARVTVEGARQQNLVQREPELAQHQMAQVAADAQALDMSRPMPTPPPEGKIVDPDPNSRRFPERRPGSGGRQPEETQPEEESRPGTEGVSGTRIDLVI